MTSPDDRRRWIVGATKIAHADRDLAHEVLADGDRGWRDVLGADTVDDDERHPVGATVAYTLELTEAEAERFAVASNCRYIEPDETGEFHRAVGRWPGTPDIPSLATLAHMRARYVDLRRWHGRDVRIAVLDQGTTPAVRAAMRYRLVARTVTTGVPVQANGLIADQYDHGCLTAPNAVPAGGLLLDCVVANSAGQPTTAGVAAGIVWAVDQGARLINGSFGGAGLQGTAIVDALNYARDAGVHCVFSAGNNSTAELDWPAAYVGSSRVDLQACKLEYSIVSPK